MQNPFSYNTIVHVYNGMDKDFRSEGKNNLFLSQFSDNYFPKGATINRFFKVSRISDYFGY